MSFTDDNLKRLKEFLNEPHTQLITLWQPTFDLKALLARLEAAEIVVGHLEALLDDCPDEQCGDIVGLSHLKAWRKSAGK